MIGFNGGLIGAVRDTSVTQSVPGIWTPGEQVVARRRRLWPVQGEPYFDKVSLLLHGDGANGSTTIVDSSLTPSTVTAAGNARISTAQSKFGGSSISFDGVSDYLIVSNAGGLVFGTGDFTIETWVYVNAWTNALNQIIGNYSGSAPLGRYLFGIAGSGASLQIRDADAVVVNQSLSTAISLSTWTHIAVARSSGTVYFFKDGVLQGPGSPFSRDLNSQANFGIGSGAPTFPNDTELNGYIDELRVTKGVARYTANFTVPDAPFPDNS